MSEKPVVSVDTTAAPPTELLCEDLTVGEGDTAAAGNTVDVHYVGVAWSTGGQFDASWDRNDVFSFPPKALDNSAIHVLLPLEPSESTSYSPS